jgi:hypothetical protein
MYHDGHFNSETAVWRVAITETEHPLGLTRSRKKFVGTATEKTCINITI